MTNKELTEISVQTLFNPLKRFSSFASEERIPIIEETTGTCQINETKKSNLGPSDYEIVDLSPIQHVDCSLKS